MLTAGNPRTFFQTLWLCLNASLDRKPMGDPAHFRPHRGSSSSPQGGTSGKRRPVGNQRPGDASDSWHTYCELTSSVFPSHSHRARLILFGRCIFEVLVLPATAASSRDIVCVTCSQTRDLHGRLRSCGSDMGGTSRKVRNSLRFQVI